MMDPAFGYERLTRIRSETTDQRERGTEGNDDLAIERNEPGDLKGPILPLSGGLWRLVHAVYPVQRHDRPSFVRNAEPVFRSGPVTAKRDPAERVFSDRLETSHGYAFECGLSLRPSLEVELRAMARPPRLARTRTSVAV